MNKKMLFGLMIMIIVVIGVYLYIGANTIDSVDSSYEPKLGETEISLDSKEGNIIKSFIEENLLEENDDETRIIVKKIFIIGDKNARTMVDISIGRIGQEFTDHHEILMENDNGWKIIKDNSISG